MVLHDSAAMQPIGRIQRSFLILAWDFCSQYDREVWESVSKNGAHTSAIHYKTCWILTKGEPRGQTAACTWRIAQPPNDMSPKVFLFLVAPIATRDYDSKQSIHDRLVRSKPPLHFD